MMQEISPETLKAWMSENKDFLLIDVREEYEFEDKNIGGKNIPLEQFAGNYEPIVDNQSPIVFCCKSGKRAFAAAKFLERREVSSELFYLKGGLDAY